MSLSASVLCCTVQAVVHVSHGACLLPRSAPLSALSVGRCGGGCLQGRGGGHHPAGWQHERQRRHCLLRPIRSGHGAHWRAALPPLREESRCGWKFDYSELQRGCGLHLPHDVGGWGEMLTFSALVVHWQFGTSMGGHRFVVKLLHVLLPHIFVSVRVCTLT